MRIWWILLSLHIFFRHATCLLVVSPWPSGEHLPDKHEDPRQMYAEVRQNKQTSSFPEGKPYQWLLNQMEKMKSRTNVNIHLTPKKLSSNKPFPLKGGLVKYSSNIQPMTHATRMWTSDNSEAESATARSAWHFWIHDPRSKQNEREKGWMVGFCFMFFCFFRVGGCFQYSLCSLSWI